MTEPEPGVYPPDPDLGDPYDLPPFRATAICLKCGGDSFLSFYHPRWTLGGHCTVQFPWPEGQFLPEHIDRECTRCHFGFVESTYGSVDELHLQQD